jgi:hypothetical protein
MYRHRCVQARSLTTTMDAAKSRMVTVEWLLHSGAGQAARHCTLCIHRLCMLFHGHQRGVDVGREAARCDTVAQQKPKIS